MCRTKTIFDPIIGKGNEVVESDHKPQGDSSIIRCNSYSYKVVCAPKYVAREMTCRLIKQTDVKHIVRMSNISHKQHYICVEDMFSESNLPKSCS